jgi:hypothetical protein
MTNSFEFSIPAEIVTPVIDVTGFPAYDRLNPARQIGAQEAAQSLNLAIESGLINPSRPIDMLDWGTAEGCSTLTLVELARINGGTVMGVDHPRFVPGLIESGILRDEQIAAGDGIEFLDRATESGRRFGLITACMFGGDQTGRLARRFIPAALGNLAEDGHLIVYSDFHTMIASENVCRQAGVEFDVKNSQLHPNRPARRVITIRQQ